MNQERSSIVRELREYFFWKQGTRDLEKLDFDSIWIEAEKIRRQRHVDEIIQEIENWGQQFLTSRGNRARNNFQGD
jgi:hypothetical protein